MTTKCETFDELRYQTFLSQIKTHSELPPTSHSIQGHLLRSHYIINQCLNLIQAENHILNPINFGWTLSNGYMMPEKYECYMPVEYTEMWLPERVPVRMLLQIRVIPFLTASKMLPTSSLYPHLTF